MRFMYPASMGYLMYALAFAVVAHTCISIYKAFSK